MKWYRVVYIQVILGIALGIVVGVIFPTFSPIAKNISEGFIQLIKMIISPIIFLTVVLGIAGVGNIKRVGKVGLKSLLYFEIVTTIALLIGMLVAHYVQPGAGVNISQPTSEVPSYIEKGKNMDWMQFVLHIIPSNIFQAFATADILQILFFSILFGFALIHLGSHTEGIVMALDKLSHVFFYMMQMIMKLAPLGAFAGMAYTIGHFGLETLFTLAKLMLAVYVTMMVFIGVILAAICRMYGLRLWPILKYIKHELLVVLGTSSSESVLPQIMQKLEQAGCKKSVVGLVIPTGYSFNLDGTSIYLSMATLFLAQLYGVKLDWIQQISILGVLMLTSKGAAAVTGGGFIVLASTLTSLQIIPLDGLAVLIGVDRFMSEARSITNLIGNTVATVVIAKSENEWDESKYRAHVHL